MCKFNIVDNIIFKSSCVNNFNSLKDEEDYLYITEIIGGSGDVITSNSAWANLLSAIK